MNGKGDVSQIAKIVGVAFLSAAGGGLFSSLIAGPERAAELSGQIEVSKADLSARIEAIRALQVEVRAQLREEHARISNLETRLTVLESRSRVRWSGPETWPGSGLPRSPPGKALPSASTPSSPSVVGAARPE